MNQRNSTNNERVGKTAGTAGAIHYSAVAILLLLVSLCAASAQESKDKMQDQSKTARPVEAELNDLAEKSNKRTPPELIETTRKSNEELEKSGILKRALNVGAVMPSFKLTDAHDQLINSADILAKGPIVIVFYRGAWCPYCNLYLRSMQKYLPEIQSRGASLIAISGESPDNSLSVEQKDNLKFTVLSDPNLTVARQFGIVYEMPKALDDAYTSRGLDLRKYYKTEKAELPLSATYVVDRAGKITFAFLDVDYKHRAEPADILAALAKLK